MDSEVYILSGKIHSGKSEALLNFVQNKSEMSGILCPLKDGLKILLNLETRETFPLEVLHQDENTLQIGKYSFLNAGFEKAGQILNSLCKQDIKTIVVDEIGKLELNGGGLEPAFSKLFRYHKQTQARFVLVVRDYLLEEVIQRYQIQNPIRIKSEQLNRID